jgi:hypothetical protein
MAKKVATINMKTYKINVFDPNATVGQQNGKIVVQDANQFVYIVKSLQANTTTGYDLNYVR